MCPKWALVRAAFPFLAAGGVFMDRSAHDILLVGGETAGLHGANRCSGTQSQATYWRTEATLKDYEIAPVQVMREAARRVEGVSETNTVAGRIEDVASILLARSSR